MNKHNAKNYLPIVQALAEGKTIQYKVKSERVDYDNLGFNDPPEYYRIKPESKLRPWKPEELTTKIGCILRHKIEKFGDAPVTILIAVRGPSSHFLCAVTGSLIDILPEKLMEEYEHSIDQGKTWHPCGVMEGE